MLSNAAIGLNNGVAAMQEWVNRAVHAQNDNRFMMVIRLQV